MQRKHSWMAPVGALVILSALIACGREGPTSLSSANLQNGKATSNDTGTTLPPSPPPPPAPGPVVSVRVTPATLTLGVGEYSALSAVGLNADNRVVGNTRATWSSSNPAVVAIADTGTLHVLKIGSSVITATIEGHTATATVTVIERPAPPPPPPPPPVTIDLVITVHGVVSASDTTQTELAPGTVVTLYRTGMPGDSSSAPPPETLVGSATTDASGRVTFRAVTWGLFRAELVPPAASPWASRQESFIPARIATATVDFLLRRR